MQAGLLPPLLLLLPLLVSFSPPEFQAPQPVGGGLLGMMPLILA